MSAAPHAIFTTALVACLCLVPAGRALCARADNPLPITIKDLAKAIGDKPDEESDSEVVFRNKLKFEKSLNGIDIVFYPKSNDSVFYLAGLLSLNRVFTRDEGEKLTEIIDKTDTDKEIGRFRVKVTNSGKERRIQLLPKK